MEELLEEANSGKVTIITSTFALVEVLKVKGHKALQAKDEKMIVDFFEHPFIRFVDPIRSVCESARHLIWKHSSLKPKDAVHLASALAFADRATLHGLFSYDADFINLHGVVTQRFPIQEPFVVQPQLRLKPDE